ncbi:hypothetical protein VCRA2119O48_110126 [Vibrio crassostreae]|nr:hypothetical protein VCRA2119O48_110126 [Vibrio crassostreae]CAK3908708.1 hypothetical protein VCRA212O16_330067 [Vibrio crassostreae]
MIVEDLVCLANHFTGAKGSLITPLELSEAGFEMKNVLFRRRGQNACASSLLSLTLIKFE